ncbi:MAG: acylphosphatase [Deltaproteobacteria bacterium]|nr:acylphosphatase [Deltaproteobacteria bacterium]
MKAAVHLLISGYVQGVGYRAWTVRTARELALHGWVRNLDDGRVEVWAEGSDDALEALVNRCHSGPRSAEVERVERRTVGARGYPSFAQAPTGDGPEASG